MASNRPWTLSEGMSLRRAGVSSFGSGGANAHAVLEEYLPASPAAGEPAGPFAIALSAKTEERLRAHARRLLDHLSDMDEHEISLASIACTLQRRQEMFFSSVLAFEKPPGQSNYAAGCTFSDAFAARMNRDWTCAVRVVNWGYWGTTGAVASAVHNERMARRGFASIEPEQGMTALHRALESPLQQLAIVAGTPAGIQSQLTQGDRLTVYPAAIPSSSEALAARLPGQVPRVPSEQLTGGLQTPSGSQQLVLRLMLGSIQALRPSWNESVAVAELKAAVSGPSFYGRWLDESIAILRKAALLHVDDERGILRWVSLELDTLWSEWDRTNRVDGGGLSPQVALLESCLHALPRVLRGKQPATDVLFGGSNAHLLERIYRGNPAADFFNSVLQSVAVAYLEARLSEDPAAQIRLLEIGAGTGGTTAGLLPRLDRFRDNIKEYCYTDISRAFLIHAEDQYAQRHPYLTTGLFDVSRPVADQNIEADRYDLVLATNVLHATADIRWALRNAKATLRKNGLLVLNELSAGSLFTHLTFGLLPGWWLHEDSSIRIPGCPGLYPLSWAAVLSDEGFGSVQFPAESAHRAGQQIVVAESDGIVRQCSGSYPQTAPSLSTRSPAANKADAGRGEQIGTARRPVAGSRRGQVTERMLEDHVKSTVRESVSDVLRMEQARIRNDRSFSDYGVDSIVGVQLIRRIGEAYGIVLPTMVVFDHNNVDDLTKYLLDVYSERVRDALGFGAPTNLRQRASGSDTPLVENPREPAGQVGVTAGSSGGFHRVVIEGPGEIDRLRIVEGMPQALGDHDVRVSVRAFALNYGDLLCVRGLYPDMPPYPFTPGLEASGIVVEAGRAVASLRPGDPVIVDGCRCMGTHATMVTCSEDEVVRKPGELSFEQACVLPIATLTMIDAFEVLTAELENTDQHEDPGLKRHGNQCIESSELSRGALSDARHLEHLATVAELFIRGYRLEYQRLFGEGYSRISLPTYPFAKESYWASRGDGIARRNETTASGGPQSESRPTQTSLSDRWLFVEEAWRSVALPDDLDWNERFRKCAGTSILVVADDDADREEMLSLLKLLTEAAGCREDLKLRSMAASAIDDDAFPEPADVVLMVGPHRSEAGPVSGTPSGVGDVFHLSRWLMRHAWDASIRMYYLYEGASSQPRPDYEALSGFMTSAMQENERHLWTLVGALDEGVENSRYQLLVKEWLCDTRPAPHSFTEVRYGSSERLIHRLHETTLRLPSTRLFRSDRTYVVTGGFGPVGWLLCEEMARRYGPTLVVLSRGEWDQSRQQKCRRLESLGSKVHYYAVDIADRSALHETYARVTSEAGPIHGVIHLARLVEDGFIVGKTWESFQRVCAPKVEGTRNLDEATAGEPLDFFAVFSSMAAFGIRGSADYGYSSAFQNAFVRHRNRLKARGERAGHAVALCWGAWAVDSYVPKNRDENLKAAGYELIGVHDALPCIEAVCLDHHAVVGLMAVGDRSKVCRRLALASPADAQPRHEAADRLKDRFAVWEEQKAAGAQALLPPIHEIVSEGELEGLDPTLVDRLYQLLFDASESSAPEVRVVDPGLGTRRATPGGCDVGMRQNVREVVSEILQLNHVEETQTFQGYGLDSITATRIAVRLERRLKRVVQPQWLIDYPTIERLAAHLESVDQQSLH